jgi:hypothetical protein
MILRTKRKQLHKSKMMVTQLVTKFPAFHRTRRLITWERTQPWAGWVQSTHHFLKICYNIILPFTSGSTMWFFVSGFPNKNLYEFLFPHIPHPSHSAWFDHPNNTRCTEQITKLLLLRSFLQPLLGPNIIPNILFPHTLNILLLGLQTLFHTHTEHVRVLTNNHNHIIRHTTKSK